MILQFKTHIWAHLEGTMGAFFHAADVHLRKLDSLQASYTRELGLSASEAFVNFNFATLRLRRHIGVLGLIHKCTLGEEHDDLAQFFPLDAAQSSYNTRSVARRHSKQVVDLCVDACPDYLRRPIYVYNLLPQKVADSASVRDFQHTHIYVYNLLPQKMARRDCERSTVDEHMFCHVGTREKSTLCTIDRYAGLRAWNNACGCLA